MAPLRHGVVVAPYTFNYSKVYTHTSALLGAPSQRAARELTCSRAQNLILVALISTMNKIKCHYIQLSLNQVPRDLVLYDPARQVSHILV